MKTKLVLTAILLTACEVQVQQSAPVEEVPRTEAPNTITGSTSCHPSCPSDLYQPIQAFFAANPTSGFGASVYRLTGSTDVFQGLTLTERADRAQAYYVYLTNDSGLIEAYYATAVSDLMQPILTNMQSNGLGLSWFHIRDARWISDTEAEVKLCFNANNQCRTVTRTYTGGI